MIPNKRHDSRPIYQTPIAIAEDSRLAGSEVAGWLAGRPVSTSTVVLLGCKHGNPCVQYNYSYL